MRIISKILTLALCLPFLLSAQEDSKKYRAVELSYMKAKIGMEAKFEAAVKAHNAKYHKEGAYESELYAIATGSETGWYVWTMGGFTFTELDGRPGEGAHQDDWDKTIAPLIAEYGRVEYWRMNSELSARNDDDDETMIQIWWLDVTRGDYYRFENIVKNVAAIHKKMNSQMSVYGNEFNQNDGRDVAIVWPLKNWAEMDDDSWKMKDEYEKENGAGSWQRLLEEWQDVIAGNVQEVWRVVK